MQIVWLFSIPDSSKYWWTGEGQLSWEGEGYENASFEVSGIKIGDQITPASIEMTGASNDIKNFWLSEPGYKKATVQSLHKNDGDIRWQLGPKFNGHLSAPEVKESVITIPIDTIINENPIIWSDENQRKRYPEDIGFSQISETYYRRPNSSWP